MVKKGPLLTGIRPHVGRAKLPRPDGIRTRPPQQGCGLWDRPPTQVLGVSVRSVLPYLPDSSWTATPDTIANRPGAAACVAAPLHGRRPPSHEVPSFARSIPTRPCPLRSVALLTQTTRTAMRCRDGHDRLGRRPIFRRWAFGILRSLPRGVGTGFRLNYGRSECAVDGLAAGQRGAESHSRVRVRSTAATARHHIGAGCG